MSQLTNDQPLVQWPHFTSTSSLRLRVCRTFIKGGKIGGWHRHTGPFLACERKKVRFRLKLLSRRIYVDHGVLEGGED